MFLILLDLHLTHEFNKLLPIPYYNKSNRFYAKIWDSIQGYFSEYKNFESLA